MTGNPAAGDRSGPDPTATVRDLVARRATATEVPTAVPLADLGVDSLGIVGLIVDLEQAFGIRLPATMISSETFHSVDSIAAAIRTLRAGR